MLPFSTCTHIIIIPEFCMPVTDGWFQDLQGHPPGYQNQSQMDGSRPAGASTRLPEPVTDGWFQTCRGIHQVTRTSHRWMVPDLQGHPPGYQNQSQMDGSRPARLPELTLPSEQLYAETTYRAPSKCGARLNTLIYF